MTDADNNAQRIFFFIIGVMTGIALTMILWTRPMASHDKLLYNDCGRTVQMTTNCGHGSPDTNPGD